MKDSMKDKWGVQTEEREGRHTLIKNIKICQVTTLRII